MSNDSEEWFQNWVEDTESGLLLMHKHFAQKASLDVWPENLSDARSNIITIEIHMNQSIQAKMKPREAKSQHK